jgi:hypothetical protein
VLNLLVLLALHVRKCAKDGVDSFRSRLRTPSQSRRLAGHLSLRTRRQLSDRDYGLSPSLEI